AIRLPSGLKAMPMRRDSPCNTRTVACVAVSSSSTSPRVSSILSSPHTEASSLPLELKETSKLICPGRLLQNTSLPEAVSQSRRVPSQLLLARRLPSGLNAMRVTDFVCPFRTRSVLREGTSHNRIVESPDPEAINFPSGLHATQATWPVWPRSTG